jgi:hypothetical protein
MNPQDAQTWRLCRRVQVDITSVYSVLLSITICRMTPSTRFQQSILLVSFLIAESFSLFHVSPIGGKQTTSLKCCVLQAKKSGEDNLSLSRRNILSLVPAGLLVSGGLLIPGENHAWAVSAAANEWGTTPDRPVVVLGAGGRTGMEVAKALAKEGIYTVTMTRSARDPDVKLDPQAKSKIQHYPDPVNVVDADSLKAVLKSVHASAIIFCASSSRLGGSVFDVDATGVGNAALAAKALDARLIVISALAVDRPDSESFKITNTLGGRLNGIMDAKRTGEEKVRRTLSQSKDYVIVRPGVLMAGKSIGPQDIEVNQGDTIGGGLSRVALAEVTVGALISGKRGVTVEVYRKATATALQPEFKLPSGSESTSDTYKGLFGSAKSD